MTAAVAGILAGLAVGAVMTRAGLCFNRGLRRAAFQGRPRVLRAFAAAVAVQLLALPILIAFGVEPLERSVESAGPALLPAGQVVGGLVFGAGMALAGGCVTGMLWKAGSGSVSLAVAIAGFAVGELLIRGPADAVISMLDDLSRPDADNLRRLLGIDYEPLAVALGIAALALLASRGRRGLGAGAVLGVVAAAAWIAADVAGYGYGLGFVGAADGTRSALQEGGSLPYQLWLALGVLAGGVLAGDRRLRLPDPARATRAAAGGILMGVGGSIAHGCNIGHGLTGVPLLSLGSLLATASMAVAALTTWRFAVSRHPHFRGHERTLTA